MSKLETNTIDTVSGTTNLVIGSTNSSTVTFENGAATGHMYPAFEARLSAFQNLSNDTDTKELAVIPTMEPSASFDVIMVTPVAKPPAAFFKSSVVISFFMCTGSFLN